MKFFGCDPHSPTCAVFEAMMTSRRCRVNKNIEFDPSRLRPVLLMSLCCWIIFRPQAWLHPWRKKTSHKLYKRSNCDCLKCGPFGHGENSRNSKAFGESLQKCNFNLVSGGTVAWLHIRVHGPNLAYYIIDWVWAPPGNSGKWRFIGIPY